MTTDKQKPVIDLDIMEVSALLLSSGADGLPAAVSFIDDALRFYGPVANQMVVEAMVHQGGIADYQLPRNYGGGILKNRLVSKNVVSAGYQILDERGLLEEDGTLSNELIDAVRTLLMHPTRTIHTVSSFANLPREDFVAVLESRNFNEEQIAALVPLEPENGWAFPVTVYSAIVIMTEIGNLVIAPTNDTITEMMIFDFQVASPGPVREIIAQLGTTAIGLAREDYGSFPISVRVTSGLPFVAPIVSTAFESGDVWTKAHESVGDDIIYRVPRNLDGTILTLDYEVAENKSTHAETAAARDSYIIGDQESALDYIASLPMIPLAQSFSLPNNV